GARCEWESSGTPESEETCQIFRTFDEGGPDGAGETGPESVSSDPAASAAGLNRGISDSDGGGISVCTQEVKASSTSMGVWYRWTGSFAIILSMMASNSSGASCLVARIGLGCRV